MKRACGSRISAEKCHPSSRRLGGLFRSAACFESSCRQAICRREEGIRIHHGQRLFSALDDAVYSQDGISLDGIWPTPNLYLSSGGHSFFEQRPRCVSVSTTPSHAGRLCCGRHAQHTFPFGMVAWMHVRTAYPRADFMEIPMDATLDIVPSAAFAIAMEQTAQDEVSISHMDGYSLCKRGCVSAEMSLARKQRNGAMLCGVGKNRCALQR